MRTEICVWRDGEISVVLAADRHLEAPNWHPDGFLIVNGGGLLWRLDMDGGLARLDTGPLTALNNDHGISPDGRTLALSDKTEEGASCIYVMPLAGGAPVRVTQAVPSWWHGWSPDGARLAYTAVRGGAFAICDCAAQGGDERVLATGMRHYDGPDYAPDGTLWFNAEDEAGAHLWRLGEDGPERMTEGDRVDWFPHPSPWGVLYLSYPPGTQGHPGGLDVELRLMPLDGGEAETLVRLRGGQGTINVPCWSPDGAFAFARYPEGP